jgi:hypothetical protein
MVAWPNTLPAPLLDSFSESPPDNILRTSMDKGPDKVRRRTTADVRPVAFSLMLTKAELQTLDDFYVVTTFSGSVEFDFEHPRTLATVSARFVEPPAYSERGGVAYLASVSLEILP